MTVGFGPLYPVDGPRPRPLLYGLVAAASIPDPDETAPGYPDADPQAGRWINGGAVWPYPADLPTGYDPCSSTSPNTKPAGTGTTEKDFGALTLVQPMSCTSRSIHDQATYADRAQVALAAHESYAVEHEFWSGLYLPSTPHLTDANAAVLNAGAATSATEALALLEDAIGATGQQGFIHATRATVSRWTANQQVYRDDPVLRTQLGTIVVLGSGYPGTAPTGHTAAGAHQAYAFATGPVEVRRSEMLLVPGTLAEAMNRSTNFITYRAERYTLTTWDGQLQSAVLIDRTL